MSNDSHGKDDHGGGDNKSPGGIIDRRFLADWFLARGLNYITGGIDLTGIIAKIVTVVLVIMTIGALIGYTISQRQAPFLYVFIPAGLGIVAYYERDIAIILFIALLLFVML